MRRRLATIIMSVVAVACGLSVAAWIRGRFRADLIGVALPGHLYFELQTHADGQPLGIDDAERTSFQLVRLWPAPPNVHWSTAPANYVGDTISFPDELMGPESYAFDWSTGSREWHWRGFICDRSRLSFLTGADCQPLLNKPRRGWKFGSGMPLKTIDGLPSLAVQFPSWAPVAATGLPMILCLATLGRTRLRAARRRRRGLCVGCGYDLRQSPGRCPECGAAAAA